MELKRLAEFLTKLAIAGMSEEAIATRGYDFALTGLITHAEHGVRTGKEFPNELKFLLMEQAADMIVQATAMLTVSRYSLAEMKQE